MTRTDRTRRRKDPRHGVRLLMDYVPSIPFHTPSANAGAGLSPALNANVLVLNRFYQAIRVVNVRRAFSLLCRDLAEVVHIETDSAGQSKWHNLDFTEW